MSDAEETESAALVKASVIEIDAQPSNALPTTEDDTRVFTNFGAILPPYDPRQLTAMYERSASLRPNIDAYKTNIEGFGHRLEPSIDIKDEDIDQKVQDALILEKIADGDPSPTAPPDEVAAAKLLLPAQMRVEKLRAEQFFKNCSAEISFIELRERTRTDLEVTGNAYWEVLRDAEGRIAQLVYLPSPSIRLLRAELNLTELEELRKVSAFSYRRFKVRRRLRKFVQVLYGQFIAYFKELDDPRVTSSKTGRIYSTVEALERAENYARPATEILHFKIHSPNSAYGVPRWVGATLAVLGSRSAEEVNVTYFDNKAVPPLAILVSGGTLAKGAADRITTYIRDNIKGKDNFHKILVLEAEPATGSIAGANGSRVRIEIKNLMEAQQQDALFQQYDSNNTEKVGNQFRLPKLLRGDMKDFNRATADAALEYAEQQVFQPERSKVDHVINRRILPHVNVRMHDFVSNAVATKDPPSLNQMINESVKVGWLLPREARELGADVFNKQFKKIEEEWADAPMPMTLAQVRSGNDATPAPPPEEQKSLEDAARQLVSLRAALAEWEGKAGNAALIEARRAESAQVQHVPHDEWDKWFAPAAE
jgi:PBSX family phage portal protein